MKAMTQPVADNPKNALADYIKELSEVYYTWYEKAVLRNYWMWTIAQAVTVAAGIATAVLAAFMREEQFKNFGVLRIALIAIPCIGTVASTFLLQTRVRDLMRLRERGRQKMQDLVTRARAEFAAASTNERYTVIHRDIAISVSRIEEEQNLGFFATVPEMTLPPRQSDQPSNAPVTG